MLTGFGFRRAELHEAFADGEIVQSRTRGARASGRARGVEGAAEPEGGSSGVVSKSLTNGSRLSCQPGVRGSCEAPVREERDQHRSGTAGVRLEARDGAVGAAVFLQGADSQRLHQLSTRQMRPHCGFPKADGDAGVEVVELRYLRHQGRLSPCWRVALPVRASG